MKEPRTDQRTKGVIKESPAIEGSKSLKTKKPAYLRKGKRTVSESPYNRLIRHDFRPGDSSDEEESKDGLSINGLGVSGKNTEASSVYTGTTKSKDDKKITPFSAKRKKQQGLKKTRVASLV